jgi:hypothetical protein
MRKLLLIPALFAASLYAPQHEVGLPNMRQVRIEIDCPSKQQCKTCCKCATFCCIGTCLCGASACCAYYGIKDATNIAIFTALLIAKGPQIFEMR